MTKNLCRSCTHMYRQEGTEEGRWEWRSSISSFYCTVLYPLQGSVLAKKIMRRTYTVPPSFSSFVQFEEMKERKSPQREQPRPKRRRRKDGRISCDLIDLSFPLSISLPSVCIVTWSSRTVLDFTAKSSCKCSISLRRASHCSSGSFFSSSCFHQSN